MKTYTSQLFLRSCDCDLNGQWRPGAILLDMQEIAGAHSQAVGVGYGSLMPRGLAWVVTRAEVHMDRYPVIGETVTTETFPMPSRHWLFPRYFIFRDEKGEQIGCAGTLWALLDLKTRRMTSDESVVALIPDNHDLTAPLKLPAVIRDMEEEAEEAVFTPAYTDLDVNRHVNNTKYVDWCCNALGIETLDTLRPAVFTVNYNNEIRAGETVRTELRRAGENFTYSGFVGEEKRFSVGGTLAKR